MPRGWGAGLRGEAAAWFGAKARRGSSKIVLPGESVNKKLLRVLQPKQQQQLQNKKPTRKYVQQQNKQSNNVKPQSQMQLKPQRSVCGQAAAAVQRVGAGSDACY